MVLKFTSWRIEDVDEMPSADLTLRHLCEKLSSKTPWGEVLPGNALIGMLAGTYTPESADAYVREQPDSW